MIATRDQIVELVRSSIAPLDPEKPAVPHPWKNPTMAPAAKEPEKKVRSPERQKPASHDPIPRTGVEIVASEQRDGVVYHTMRDLRNLNIVENVTHDSARRLWRYAIKQRESGEPVVATIKWDGTIGIVRLQKQRNGGCRYDLAYRKNGTASLLRSHRRRPAGRVENRDRALDGEIHARGLSRNAPDQ